MGFPFAKGPPAGTMPAAAVPGGQDSRQSLEDVFRSEGKSHSLAAAPPQKQKSPLFQEGFRIKLFSDFSFIHTLLFS